jgi:hypothetical protein
MSLGDRAELQSSSRIEDYSDEDLTFFMVVFRNFELAAETLQELRDHFPRSRVVVRSDGDPDPRYSVLNGRYELDYRSEERLFSARHGAAVVQRMLDIYLEQPTAYLFKIDPDTEIHRRFRYLPADSSMFGTLQGTPDYLSIQGGCLGFTRDAAERIASSRLLLQLDRILRDKRVDWPSHLARFAKRARETGLASFDWSLGWVADEIGIRLIDFLEVYCTYGTVVSVPIEEKDTYAVTHPKVVSDASIDDYLRLRELRQRTQTPEVRRVNPYAAYRGSYPRHQRGPSTLLISP